MENSSSKRSSFRAAGHLFVAIDRTSKFSYVELHVRAGKMIAAQFLRNLVAAVPYKIHTILTPSRDIPA